MLTKIQISQIKEHLEKAQNPLFFFDNDPDGLCSFLLLQRYIGRGKGVPVRTFPALDKAYIRKIEELSPDYIFILDKPLVSDDFFEEVQKLNLPIVWIDHHEINPSRIPSFVNYFNPFFNEDKTNEPVTALCAQINTRKEDFWIAVAGSVSDNFIPGCYENFIKEYPELGVKSSRAFEILYKSKIGKIIRIFLFGLKDKTTNVDSMLKFLVATRGPYDILEENSENRKMHERFEELEKKYRSLLSKALIEEKSGDIIFFKYGGETSISSDLSNELAYLFPEKLIVVIYENLEKMTMAIRGRGVRSIILKILPKLNGATGGGHENAVGMKINSLDLENFKKLFSEEAKTIKRSSYSI
jgi:single-stranded DNA-specific DHH superfamily exonuclease